MGTVHPIADRRYWPAAQDAWAGGWPAIAPQIVVDDVPLAAEWRASMKRLAKRLGVTVRTTATAPGRLVAVANGGYPLDVRTAPQRDEWDRLRADAESR